MVIGEILMTLFSSRLYKLMMLFYFLADGFGFDRDYRNAYSRLRNSDEYETMDKGDTPPPDTALFCRKFFRDLSLV
jgi:hypothetical protein